MCEDIEIWVAVPMCNGYEASSLGRVRSLNRIIKDKKGWDKKISGKILNPSVNKRGYLATNIVYNGIRINIEVQRIIAMAFLGHTPNGSSIVVDHIDKNPLNNRADNLRLITQRENVNRTPRGRSRYAGVQWNEEHKKWRVMVRHKGKRFYVGIYSNEETAHKAYLNKLNELGCTITITEQ